MNAGPSRSVALAAAACLITVWLGVSQAPAGDAPRYRGPGGNGVYGDAAIRTDWTAEYDTIRIWIETGCQMNGNHSRYKSWARVLAGYGVEPVKDAKGNVDPFATDRGTGCRVSDLDR